MNVNPDRFTELGISAIQEMAEVAKKWSTGSEVWHLLSTLMNQENGIVPSLMDKWSGYITCTTRPAERITKFPKIAGNVNTARSYASAALTGS